jgi:hypothetical protein
VKPVEQVKSKLLEDDGLRVDDGLIVDDILKMGDCEGG